MFKNAKWHDQFSLHLIEACKTCEGSSCIGTPHHIQDFQVVLFGCEAGMDDSIFSTFKNATEMILITGWFEKWATPLSDILIFITGQSRAWYQKKELKNSCELFN